MADSDLNMLVQKFKGMHDALRITSLDCFMVISKIMKLLNDYYLLNEERRYKMTPAEKTDVQARKEYQSLLTNFADQLTMVYDLNTEEGDKV
jgi:hypothetical protein